jgi:BirA family biotin operon repressor/biotin-[acetyl-CoA-carboxylase] ligase
MLPGSTYHKEITDSTQNDARNLIINGTAGHGDICTASYQSAGRGRIAGRVWESDKDQALLMTLILEKKKIHPSPPLSLILGLALSLAMEKAFELSPKVKWPNDIYIDQKKAAGILCESEKDFFLCGMGINMNQSQFPESIKDKAISLKQIMGRSLDQESFLIDIKSEIFLQLQRPSHEILDNLEFRLCWQNEKKILLLGDPGKKEELTGIIRGLNSDGALLFESAGELKKVYSAEFKP